MKTALETRLIRLKEENAKLQAEVERLEARLEVWAAECDGLADDRDKWRARAMCAEADGHRLADAVEAAIMTVPPGSDGEAALCSTSIAEWRKRHPRCAS